MLVVHENDDLVACPKCRANMPGSTAVIAYCGYIPANPPRPSSSPRSEAYSSAQSQDEQVALVALGSLSVDTQVNGHLSMVVDIGAFVNVFGEKRARTLARVGGQHGQTSSRQRLDQPVHIHGVGQGGQVCRWSATMLIAVQT